jgi:beta-glucosidase
VIGPLADSQHDLLGPWWGRGEDADVVSVRSGITAASSGTTTYAQGCALSNKEPADYDPADDCPTDAGFAKAVATAKDADQVVLALGETREMSGEATTRSTIDLPGKQQELIDAIAATGKPFVVVLFNGRPLTLSKVIESAPAVLEAWFPGVEAGNAVSDVVFGKVNPGGKLPVSFPQRLGQVPIYYNHEPTGRPCDVTQKYNSRYRDLRSCDPLFPFGFGLSYTKFEFSDLKLSKTTVSPKGSVVASMTIANTGDVAGDDVAQLYIHDPVASISQPVRRLRGFERVTLKPGESTTVRFTLDASDFGFYDNRGKFVVEPGAIQVYAGDDSTATLTKTFEVSR